MTIVAALIKIASIADTPTQTHKHKHTHTHMHGNRHLADQLSDREKDDYRNPACIADNVGDNVGGARGKRMRSRQCHDRCGERALGQEDFLPGSRFEGSPV